MQAIDIQSEEFLESLRLGKQEAFQVLFEAFHKPLCFFAARVVRDGEEAEDIVQEVFLSFWKMERDGFPNIKTIKTFFYNSVQNRCLNYLRDLEIRDRNYRNLNREELDEDSSFANKSEPRLSRSCSKRLTNCRRKARRYSKSLISTDQEDKKIAEELGISLNTIKTQKQRAKSYLRVRLGDLFVYVGMFFPGF